MSGNGGDLQMDPQKVVRMLSLMDQMDQHLARTVAKQKAQRRRAKLQRKKRKEKQKAKRAKIRQLLSAEKGDGGGTAALVALSILSGSASSSQRGVGSSSVAGSSERGEDAGVGPSGCPSAKIASVGSTRGRGLMCWGKVHAQRRRWSLRLRAA